MAYEQTVAAVRDAIEASFAELDRWFERPAAERGYRPRDGGWTIDQLLEHVTLTSHFLLLIIRKGCAKAAKRAASVGLPAAGESDLAALEPIGHPDAFAWLRPEHMEPAGAPAAGVRGLLGRQRDECLALLDSIAGGAGARYSVRMSVQSLGKLDMYQWLYFLAQHARRHGAEIAAVAREWEASND
ncbi:MAG TPA: DinB family protein [Herpetosiphonaceae bacterium]